MDANGNYTLRVRDRDIGAGESATVSFDVQVVDDSGDVTTNTSVAQQLH